MPINFPNIPSPNQLYSYDGKTWEWNGVYWEVYSALTSYITSAYTVGDGFSDISGVTGGNIALKSFSGVNISIIDSGNKLTFSASSSGGVTSISAGNGLSASSTSGAVSLVNTQVQGITGKTDGLGISSTISNNNITITNSDRGSSQNIFKNIQITGTTQFSAGSNSSDLNFSGVNINIFSASSNTLVFSAGTGGGGGGNAVAIYDETDLLTSNVSSIDFVGNGVIATTVGNNVTVTIPGGLTAVTTLIATNSFILVPNNSIYIGNSTYGWNGLTWDLDNLTFDATYSNCGVPLTRKVNPGKITICGIAYINDSSPTTCDFSIYIYEFSCGAVEGITSLVLLDSVETKNAYDRMGIKCFTFEYILKSGEILKECSDFIVIGFQSTSNDATQVKISYSLSST